MYRTGIGFDAHRFATGRRLMLGGVEIPFELGLKGHSDADVLAHSVCDALFGAAGERDIGFHFPDTDPKYRGVSSLLLLKETLTLVKSKGFIVENIDSTVVCENPKLSAYIPAIKSSLAAVLEISDEAVGVKATTSDAMGFTGRGEGVVALTVALIRKIG
ncbi:MAG: 2-C-methyl-D-erythritol 2,4-cyclodiphosphate synthase [Deltaproteobacteria bacterium]